LVGFELVIREKIENPTQGHISFLFQIFNEVEMVIKHKVIYSNLAIIER
jgi:hypothetical protein